MTSKYLRPGRYNPSNGMFIYYEKGSNAFYAGTSYEDENIIEVCYGPCSGGADYWDIAIEHKKALLRIVDKKGFDTRALLKYVREHDLNKSQRDEMKNGLGVKLSLVGKDSNAYALLGLFICAAKRQGFTNEQIDPIIKEAKSGDYAHLLCTLMDNIN